MAYVLILHLTAGALQPNVRAHRCGTGRSWCHARAALPAMVAPLQPSLQQERMRLIAAIADIDARIDADRFSLPSTQPDLTATLTLTQVRSQP